MSTASDRMLERLAPLATYDAENGGVVAALAAALAAPQAVVDDVARETDTHRPWQAALDPDACPAAWLPWLAQFAGVTLLPADDEAAQRQRIKRAAGYRRGTVPAMIEEVKATLTGTQSVTYLRNVDGNPWLQTIVTRTSETPNPAATEQAARRQKVAGVKLTVITSDEPIVDEFTRTIDNLVVAIDDFTPGDVT